MSTDNSIKSSISLVLFARINFNRRRRRLSGDATWQSPGANLRDVFIVWRLERFPINERPWYVGPREEGCEREIKERTPCIGERNSRSPSHEEAAAAAASTRISKESFRRHEPISPRSTVDSYLIAPIFMISHYTAPLVRIYSRERRDAVVRVPCRPNRITICDTLTVDVDVDFISVPRGRNIFLWRNVNWRLICSGIFR